MKAKDIRKGIFILHNNAPHQVMEFTHRTPGNLRAFVQAKLRHAITGLSTETRFSSTEELVEADVFSFQGTYLYQDAGGYHFMNSNSYEEVVLPVEILGDQRFILQDSMSVEISVYDGTPIGIKLPKSVVVTITETDPELKGATATNVYKPAKTESGLQIAVPPFIKVGERVIVDTEEMRYLSRAD